MEKKKSIVLTVIASVTLILLVVGATFAYFQATGGVGASSKINVTSYTTDILTFETGSDIAISADQESFAQGEGNASGSTFAKATLVANGKTNTATDNYNVYLNIESNEFEYTQVNKTPELLLQVTDPSGNEVTSLPSLEYKTVKDGNGQTIKGFDITNFKGLVLIANNKEINANPKTVENYDISVVFVNLDVDQSANAGKSLNAKVMIQKELLLTAYVQNLYTGTQGENNVYYHNGTILGEDGAVLDAEDYSYRFAGADEHEAYYTCTYDGNKVFSTRSASDNNHSYQGDCASVYSDGAETPTYVDKSVYDTEVPVVWNGESNVCLTIDGHELSNNNLTEEDCTGKAYKIMSLYSKINLSYVGIGTETLYEEAGGVSNNYMCFGSTETPCPYENLYRIIGTFDGKTKLIKIDIATEEELGTDGDYAGNYIEAISTNVDSSLLGVASEVIQRGRFIYNGERNILTNASYYWNYKNVIDNEKLANDWSTSLLNKVNLNKNFLNTFEGNWSNLIAYNNWKIYPYLYDFGKNNIPLAKQTYNIEHINSNIDNNKIGLMYLSDALYSSKQKLWNDSSNILDSGMGKIENDWLNIGAFEYLLFYYTSDDYIFAFAMGGIYAGKTSWPSGIRPVFYLNSDVTYKSGTGTKDDPITINLD